MTQALRIGKPRLVTMPELRQHMSLTPSVEARVSAVLPAVIRLWERMTRRLWQYRESYVETLITRPAQQTLMPVLRPIKDVVKLEEWAPGDDDSPTLVEATDYTLLPIRGRLERHNVEDRAFGHNFDQGRRLWWQRFVRITITGGYVSANDSEAETLGDDFITPEEITEVIALQCTFTTTRNTSEKIDTQGQSMEGQTINLLPSDAHPQFKKLAKQMSRKLV